MIIAWQWVISCKGDPYRWSSRRRRLLGCWSGPPPAEGAIASQAAAERRLPLTLLMHIDHWRPCKLKAFQQEIP